MKRKGSRRKGRKEQVLGRTEAEIVVQTFIEKEGEGEGKGERKETRLDLKAQYKMPVIFS